MHANSKKKIAQKPNSQYDSVVSDNAFARLRYWHKCNCMVKSFSQVFLENMGKWIQTLAQQNTMKRKPIA